MAGTPTTEASVTVVTDEAPWMQYARAEAGKRVHELFPYAAFKSALFQAFAAHGFVYCDGSAEAMAAEEAFDAILDAARPALRSATERANADIAGYFGSLRHKPSALVKPMGDGWQMQAWCAAFVNWCLEQAGVPRREIATAAAWLDFGTPLAVPAYGCIAVLSPSSSTGSTTGHVGFYVRTTGDRVVILGGNQRDAVNETGYPTSRVRGFRWPTAVDYSKPLGRATA